MKKSIKWLAHPHDLNDLPNLHAVPYLRASGDWGVAHG
jgi:hypothetical protein